LARKKFRKDLYYRIRGGWLHLPPLRDRKEDIPLLVSYLLQKHFGVAGNHIVEPKVMDLLMAYSFPGNVRELQSIILSSLNLAQGKPISIQDLPDELKKQKTAVRSDRVLVKEPVVPLSEVEKAHILEIYTQMENNKSKTARLLGIGLNTLRRKLLSYGVN
jgi:transcriptional regulator with PAS, ATPase and Fis domain